MPQSPRDILRRIRGIKSTQQITKAMEMVAAVKLNRIRAQAENSRPYVDSIRLMMQALCISADDIINPLFDTRPVERIILVVMTSDRGLCGTFNANLISAARAFIEEHWEKDVSIVAIGRKGQEALARSGCSIERSFDVPWGEAIGTEMRVVSAYLQEAFVKERCDAVHLLYSRFENVLKHVPTVTQYLPVPQLTEAEKKSLLKMSAYFLIEPNYEEMANVLTPTYLETQLYHSMVESLASEYGARMVAMRNANDNAEEVIADLTLSYNKARQATITRELIDIIGGAEALRG